MTVAAPVRATSGAHGVMDRNAICRDRLPRHFGFPVDEIRQLSNDGKNGTSRVNDKLKGPRCPGLDAEMGRLSDTEH